MFSPNGMEQMRNSGEKIEYKIPDVSNIASWELAKLEDEFKKIEEEREELLNKMNTSSGIPDAKIVNRIKELAFAGRAMFFELEKRNKK